MIISTVAKKAFNKIQHSFMIKTFSKLVIEENFFNPKRSIKKTKQTIANIRHNDEILGGFLLSQLPYFLDSRDVKTVNLLSLPKPRSGHGHFRNISTSKARQWCSLSLMLLSIVL